MLMVAFGHEKDVGKSQAAKFLISYLRTHIHGSNIQKHSFAWKVKDIGYQLYSWAGLQPPDYYETKETKHLKDVILPKLNKTPRQIWIKLGNNIRDTYPDTFVDFVRHNIICDVVIMDDLRYLFEANRILHHEGFIFKIQRPSIVRTSDEADDDLLGFNNWTDIIINDLTLRELNLKVIEMAKEYIIPKLRQQNII